MTGAPEAQFIWEGLRSELKFGNWETIEQGAKFLGCHPKEAVVWTHSFNRCDMTERAKCS